MADQRDAGSAPAFDTPQAVADAFTVSRETLARLEQFDAFLQTRTRTMNLVAPSTLPDRWRRHFADSAQLADYVPPGTRRLVDVGSGAGFPGLVLAAMLSDRGVAVELVESVAKKARFLRECADHMGLTNVAVRNARIEAAGVAPPDVVTARAVAPLARLFAFLQPAVGEATLCILPKGQDVENELTEATKSWHMDVEKRPSATNAAATVLLVTGLRPMAARADLAQRRATRNRRAQRQPPQAKR